MRGRRRRTAISLLVGVLLGAFGLVAAAPAPAAASCAAPSSAADAVLFGDVVFVGTVLRTENDGRWATIRVEERWKAARDLADTVTVRGGPEPGTATSIDRAYQPGRYLFVVKAADGYLADDACSGTRLWSDDLATLRPAGVSAAAHDLPADPLGAIDPGELALLAVLLIALLVAIVAYLWVLRARRRPPDWVR